VPTTSPQQPVYDAFISYRHQEPDKTFARDMLARLEAAGLKVAIDERDFAPNEQFLPEMERCVKESRFTLAVISPRYLGSGNCLEEAVICKVLDMGERKRRLVPLIIEKVEMPTWLYTLTGINFTDKDPLIDPHQKLLKLFGRPSSPGGRSSASVSPTRLRHGADHLFGRDEELALLDAAWANPKTHIQTIVAWGGVGKTSLVAT